MLSNCSQSGEKSVEVTIESHYTGIISIELALATHQNYLDGVVSGNVQNLFIHSMGVVI